MKPILQEQLKGMNRLEMKYSCQLELLKRAGEIIDYRFEALKFKLADRTYYTPDFLVVFKDRFECHEVKGFWREDARVKIKVTAHQFPYFKFKAIQHKRRRWSVEEF